MGAKIRGQRSEVRDQKALRSEKQNIRFHWRTGVAVRDRHWLVVDDSTAQESDFARSPKHSERCEPEIHRGPALRKHER